MDFQVKPNRLPQNASKCHIPGTISSGSKSSSAGGAWGFPRAARFGVLGGPSPLPTSESGDMDSSKPQGLGGGSAGLAGGT